MKKRMRLTMLAAILLTMLSVLLISMFYIAEQKQSETRKLLRSHMIILSQFTSDINEESDFLSLGTELRKSLQGEIRLTFIGKSGKVYYDSELSASQMENHNQRPEFVSAKQTGYGEDIRGSQSTGMQTIYACMPLNHEVYVRMAMPLDAVNRYVYGVSPSIFICCAGIVLAAIWLSDYFSKRFIRPYFQLAASLESLLSGQSEPVANLSDYQYEELRPIIRTIRELDLKLQQYLVQLQEKSHEIESILAAVDDGILMLNRKMDVLTRNQKANELFPTTGNFGQSCRNPQLLEKIDQTISTGLASFLDIEILRFPGKTFRCLVSPAKAGTVSGEGQVYGVVVSISDITEIKKLERMRSEFVSNFSHEMKSPLTSIKGFAELLKNDMVSDPDKIKQYLEIIITESAHMVHLIQDMLKLSELETQQKSSLQYTTVALRELVDKIRTTLTFQAEIKGITFTVEGKASAQTDYEKFSEILLNILDNAIKYNREQGEIRVRLWETANEAYVCVWDSGIGIPQESIDRIFERFYRVDKARSRKAGSTGLGLSIVKHNAELLGAVLEVESQQNQYTQLTIHLQKQANL